MEKVEGDKSKKEKKKDNIKYIAIIVITVIVIMLSTGITGYKFMQEMILVSEINKLVTEKDFIVDTVDVDDIKTRGEYAKIERAIKTYFNDFSIQIQKTIKIIGDEKIRKIVSIENYKQDGPEFTQTLSYIDAITKQIDEASEKILRFLEKEEMLKYLDKCEVDEKYKELLETGMMDEETESDLELSQADFQYAIDILKSNLQVSNEIIEFLKQNKNKWTIEDDIIVFDSQKLLDQYDALESKLQ